MAVAISRVTPAVIHRLQIPVQVLLYAGLFVFAQYLVSWLHLPLPANLVGMVLMLALIVCRVIPLNWIRAGARWLLAEMLLFLSQRWWPSSTTRSCCWSMAGAYFPSLR